MNTQEIRKEDCLHADDTSDTATGTRTLDHAVNSTTCSQNAREDPMSTRPLDSDARADTLYSHSPPPAPLSLSERFKIFNSIDEFKPFQVELMEKLAELKCIAMSIATGIGKTTMIKYISLDFLDMNPANRCLILVNTRALTYDISQSLCEILDGEYERSLVCNLNEHDINRPLTKAIADKARLFIGVPDKYLSCIKKLPRKFNFVCVDEVDALLDRDEPQSSSIIHVLDSISFEYSLVSSATFSEDVYTHVVYKYNYFVKTFKENIPNIEIKRILYDKHDKYWHTSVCDKIHHIILENPLMNKVIVFCNFRNDCDRLYEDYKMCASQPNYCIHGNMESARIQELFKAYKSNGKVLFTTDMCQRGLDIKDIDIIFHIGITGDTDFYHRNGRTLRKSGAEPLCFIFTQTYDLQNYPKLNEFPEKHFESSHSYSKYKYATPPHKNRFAHRFN